MVVTVAVEADMEEAMKEKIVNSVNKIPSKITVRSNLAIVIRTEIHMAKATVTKHRAVTLLVAMTTKTISRTVLATIRDLRI